jgi:hypothetical protein
VVSFIHSFSAADPRDASTLAGRWLEHGAYVYYGSMNEPFLSAFRTPRLVLELAAAELPLAAVLREGESETFGRPWRLVYLGDPLYTLDLPAAGTRSLPRRLAPEGGRPPSLARARLAGTVLSAEPPGAAQRPTTRLESCLDAAIRSLCRGDARRPADRAWRTALEAIDRRGLGPSERAVLDELLIDTLLHSGDAERLLGLLLKIPVAESSPRAGFAIETLMMGRLTNLAASGSSEGALAVWDAMIRRPWPAGSSFPADLTERLAGHMKSPPDRALYLRHLKEASATLAGRPPLAGAEAVVRKELERLLAPTAPRSR